MSTSVPVSTCARNLFGKSAGGCIAPSCRGRGRGEHHEACHYETYSPQNAYSLLPLCVRMGGTFPSSHEGDGPCNSGSSTRCSDRSKVRILTGTRYIRRHSSNVPWLTRWALIISGLWSITS